MQKEDEVHADLREGERMRSPLSSRRNSRPEWVTPDDAIDLVASSIVMIFPSVSQLRLDSAR
jgi:hypothetical protein